MMKMIGYPVAMLTVLLAASLVAGCLGSDDDPTTDPEFVTEPVTGLEIEHERGTAYEKRSSFIVATNKRCAFFGPTLADACRETYPVMDAVPHVDTVPAPTLDFTQVTFAETSTDLIITMEIAELDEQWSALDPPDDGTMIRYMLCWEEVRDKDETEAWGCPVFAVRQPRDEILFTSLYGDVSECNDWWWCPVDVDYEVQYGEPGIIQMTIPRVLLPNGEQGDSLTGITFGTDRLHGRTTYMGWSVQEGPVDEQGWNTMEPIRGNEKIDSGSSEEPFTFQTPRSPVDTAELTVNHHNHTEGVTFDETGQYRPDIDILGYTLEETTTELTLSIELAQIDEDPKDHWLWLALGMPSGRVHQAGYNIVEGQREVYAGHDVPDEDWRWDADAVAFEVETGSPGRVQFTWNRDELGSPSSGERVNLAWLETDLFPPDLDEQYGPLGVEFTRDAMNGGDWVEWGLPYWFESDTASSGNESVGSLIQDDIGDTRIPDGVSVDEVNENQYDITYVETKGLDPATVKVSLGVQDLSNVEVPMGYEAIVYAVGLHTDAGKFKVFYYKDDDQQGYYCATDSLVLIDEPSDPNGVVWTQVPGLLSNGGRAPGGVGLASGAISFDVPHECLGVEVGKPFEVHELAAGTYLLEDPLGLPQLAEVHTVDAAESNPADLPVSLGIAAIASDPAEPAWYAAPLGLGGQDWDVLGVAIAILLATGGAFVVYQRRRKLRHYLNRVSHTAKIKDLTARETGLGELREALRADLVGGKIAESHYTIILRHIEDAMKNVRVKSIEETFRELPFHVVSKLRAVLDDGVITQDEREMVMDLVDRVEIPMSDKQKVLSRLERWQLVDEVAKA